jgi:hypothetical protein
MVEVRKLKGFIDLFSRLDPPGAHNTIQANLEMLPTELKKVRML